MIAEVSDVHSIYHTCSPRILNVYSFINIDLNDHCFEYYQIESNIVRCPDPEYAEKMIAAIDAVRMRGESIGGVVTCIVKNCPPVCLSLSFSLS